MLKCARNIERQVLCVVRHKEDGSTHMIQLIQGLQGQMKEGDSCNKLKVTGSYYYTHHITNSYLVKGHHNHVLS